MPEAGVFEKEFTVPLHEHDRAEFADEQAALHNRREMLKDQKRTSLAGFKQQLAGIDDRLGEVAEWLTNGARKVKIKCERRAHPTRPIWQIVRIDTHEVVDELPMDIDEIGTARNGDLPLYADGGRGGDDDGHGGDHDQGDAGEDESRGVLDEEAQRAAEDNQAYADLHEVEPGRSPAPEQAAPTAKGRKKPPTPICPFILEQPSLDDPRQDVTCTAAGSARAKGFCSEHYELTGGKNANATQKLCLARRTKRRQLEADASRGARKDEGGGSSMAGDAPDYDA
jgi:hypothetical protein